MTAQPDGRRLVITRASDIEATTDIVGPINGWQLVDIIREILPDQWRVLPDGRSTAKAILAAFRAHENRSTKGLGR